MNNIIIILLIDNVCLLYYRILIILLHIHCLFKGKNLALIFLIEIKILFKRCKPASLSLKTSISLIVSLARSNHFSVEGFDIDENNFIIDYIVT